MSSLITNRQVCVCWVGEWVGECSEWFNGGLVACQL